MFGPVVSASLWLTVGPRAPLVAAGIVKALFDLALLVAFQKVKPPEEEDGRAGSSKEPNADGGVEMGRAMPSSSRA